MIKVLFVCLGNICRSPLAEAIFQNKIELLGLQRHFSCDSAGTGAYHIGKNPDHRSIAVAVKNNIKISHKGRQYTSTDAQSFNYILAMDSHNFEDIISISGKKPDGLFLMRDFDNTHVGGDVPDPYYGGGDSFDHVYNILDRSIDNFIKHIRSVEKI